ncbi:MAG TPA: Zn-ribbon containing protein [Methanolinea sp.]|nr:Zn-ribbon containing protein [Methanolinea sp.]HQK55576.1 Zn-ribbon containing protein [Methanolinea sp.]
MPHRCVNCGREYRTNECEILKGCRECGGKKFIFVPLVERSRDEGPVPSEGTGDTVQKEVETQEVELPPGYEPLESIRIVSPGTYELNIEKLANSDERVVGVGKGEGSYLVDLLSMVRPKKKKNRK